jgi:Family of unknown function (DUF6166)
MKFYHIQRGPDGVTVRVTEGDTTGIAFNEYPLALEPSLAVSNHSPTGFEFGYGGSGPAQLALAILMDFTGKVPDPACYQAFKWMFIAPMKHPGGVIAGNKIEEWLDHQMAEPLSSVVPIQQ